MGTLEKAVKYRKPELKKFIVYRQVEGELVYMDTVDAEFANDALRIAKQKGYFAPVIGDAPSKEKQA